MCVCVCVCVSHRAVSVEKHKILSFIMYCRWLDTVKRLREINLNLLTVTCFDKALYSFLNNTRNLVYLQGFTCDQY